MPVIVPPSITPLSQGHRITSHYYFTGDDVPNGRPILGGSSFNPIFLFDIAMIKVQGASNIGPIRTVQFSYVGFPNETNILGGVLWVVVDSMQVFTFEVPQSNASSTGFFASCFNAMFPVVANNQSTISFGLFVGEFSQSSPGFPGRGALGDLYVTLMDFDAGTFSYASQGILPSPTLTIDGTIPVDVVNTSMDVFVNNTVDLPVPVTTVP